ncbi:hypothetical protein C7212DRAFT_46755, partial [Tuber magnatum]
PASILETAGIKVCIVGSAVVRLFRSDLLIGDIGLAIAEEQFDLSLSLLHSHGFHDIHFEHFQLDAMPALSKPGGWVARRLQYPPTSDIIVLTPARYWHLDITPDMTFLPYPHPYRYLHFLAYLEALIRTIDTLVPSGDKSLLFTYQYAIMAELLPQQPDLEAMISPGDRFFIDFYMKQVGLSSMLKVLELRNRIIEGSISVETAGRIVPRPDLARKRIKEKY